MLINQLNQLAVMQMFGPTSRPEPQPIDLNNPATINPDNMTYEQLLELEEKMGKVSRGLPKEDIKKIPKFKHHSGKKEEPCTICFNEYVRDDKLRKLPCQHLYHSKCIKQWLLNEKTCPICKAEVAVK